MNPYYVPEKLGLTIVAEADEGSYDFDMFVVWKDEAGALYWGSDSGCSCYPPFDQLTIDDLNTGSVEAMWAAVDEWAGQSPDYQAAAHDIKRRVVLG